MCVCKASASGTALAVPVFERKKWCRLNFTRALGVPPPMFHCSSGRLSMTRPSTDFFEVSSVQSDNDWIVDFPYDIQAQEQNGGGSS